MRQVVQANLSQAIDAGVVTSLMDTYQAQVAAYRRGDLETCLNQAGKFVEHALRAIEYLRTGVAPPEIKRVDDLIRELSKATNLPESLRSLVPKVGYSMLYEMRSKRGAVHVKEIDPRHIDAALCVQGASWILAEFLRLFHSDSESAIAEAMAMLVRAEIPLVEVFGDETVVTSKVTCPVEILLLIAKALANGADRHFLGIASKYSAATVTRSIQKLESDLFIHKTKDGKFHITGPGEKYLSRQLIAYETSLNKAA